MSGAFQFLSSPLSQTLSGHSQKTSGYKQGAGAWVRWISYLSTGRDVWDILLLRKPPMLSLPKIFLYLWGRVLKSIFTQPFPLYVLLKLSECLHVYLEFLNQEWGMQKGGLHVDFKGLWTLGNHKISCMLDLGSTGQKQSKDNPGVFDLFNDGLQSSLWIPCHSYAKCHKSLQFFQCKELIPWLTFSKEWWPPKMLRSIGIKQAPILFMGPGHD